MYIIALKKAERVILTTTIYFFSLSNIQNISPYPTCLLNLAWAKKNFAFAPDEELGFQTKMHPDILIFTLYPQWISLSTTSLERK